MSVRMMSISCERHTRVAAYVCGWGWVRCGGVRWGGCARDAEHHTADAERRGGVCDVTERSDALSEGGGGAWGGGRRPVAVRSGVGCAGLRCALCAGRVARVCRGVMSDEIKVDRGWFMVMLVERPSAVALSAAAGAMPEVCAMCRT